MPCITLKGNSSLASTCFTQGQDMDSVGACRTPGVSTDAASECPANVGICIIPSLQSLHL